MKRRAPLRRLSQLPQELLAKSVAEDTIGKKERVLAAGDPAGAIGRDASARHDAVQVGMEMQILTPGMQHREEADGGAQKSGVCRHFQQGLGSSTEQNVINLSRVLKGDVADLVRESKHDVEIGDGQKLRLPLCEPLGAGRGLALGTMAIAARIV